MEMRWRDIHTRCQPIGAHARTLWDPLLSKGVAY